jgi:hypothetical protein
MAKNRLRVSFPQLRGRGSNIRRKLIAVVIEAAHKDARHAEWLLERQFPAEFAPYDRRPVPVEPRLPEPPPDLSKSVKLLVPDGFFEQMLEENARMAKALDKLPVGAGINPRTGVITMPDGTVITPDNSEPESEWSESETDG